MSDAPLTGSPGFDIKAEVGLRDAMLATLWPTRNRALCLGVCFAILGTVAWFRDGFADWALAAVVLFVGGAHFLAGCLVYASYANSGGKPARMRYHVCESGFEVRGAGFVTDWIVWEDVHSVRETPGSFVLRPTGSEQYVVPKRCCTGEFAARMRDAVRHCRQPATRPK